MSNTIELLEAIGKDASLRHASGESLGHALSGMQASELLLRAARSGDSSQLTPELGHRDIKANNHVNQAPCHPDDHDDDDNHEQQNGDQDGSEVKEN